MAAVEKMAFTDEFDEFLVELIRENPPLYDARLNTYKDNVVRDNIWEYIASKLNKTSDDCKRRWKCIRDSYQRIKRKNKLPTGSAAGSKSKKWALLERLCFLDKVPTERRTICNIENADGANDSENEESNQDENSFNTEKESNEGTRETIMDNAATSATEVNIEETADVEEQNKMTKRSSGPPPKKKKQRQKSTMQAILLQYWKDRDTERRTQVQELMQQSTSNREEEADVDGIKSFCSHVGTILSKLTPALRLDAKTKVFSILADYELRNLNQSSSNSSSSRLVEENSSTNPYSSISNISSPESSIQPTDLSTSNAFNLLSNTYENMSNTLYEQNDVND